MRKKYKKQCNFLIHKHIPSSIQTYKKKKLITQNTYKENNKDTGTTQMAQGKIYTISQTEIIFI